MMDTFLTLASEAPNGRFIPGDPKELYFGAAAFAVVFALMVLKLFPLISKALGERGEKVKVELAAAEQAQAAAHAEVQALKAKLGDAASDGEKLVADARLQAEKLKADGAVKADADAAALRTKAASDVEGMRAQTSADVSAEVSARTLEAAEKIAMANLDDATQAQLIEQYISQVGASS